MRFSSLTVLVVLGAVLALSYADDAPKNPAADDVPKELERRDAPVETVVIQPAEGGQQADAQEPTGMEAAVSRAQRVRRWGYGYGGWGGGYGMGGYGGYGGMYRPWGGMGYGMGMMNPWMGMGGWGR
ncbi:hypothetical protein AAVH_21010 [Aphelenchoides avenae]|nr:hypothetical protein AAVH_21010 [Aphelenchus avenae]